LKLFELSNRFFWQKNEKFGFKRKHSLQERVETVKLGY
jgi:hypothetical protein